MAGMKGDFRRNKKDLIAELEQWRADAGVDVEALRLGNVLLKAIVEEIRAANVRSYGLKPETHDLWVQRLAEARDVLQSAAVGEDT